MRGKNKKPKEKVIFASEKELFEDPYFKERFKFHHSETLKNRRMRKEPGKGRRWRRDWYDQMQNQNQLGLSFFENNLLEIYDKKSSLPARTRDVIRYVGDCAAQETLQHYQKLNSEIDEKR